MEQNDHSAPLKIGRNEALSALAGRAQRFAVLFEQADLSLEIYAPVGTDPQAPHSRDELYVVAAGTGRFRRGAEIVEFGPGDVLFVPAWMPHRFEDFSADFATWVVFFGPERERPAA